MIGTRLGTSARLGCNRLAAIRPCIQRTGLQQTKLLTRQTTKINLIRSYGGGTVGLTKLIIIFGSLGGITIFIALATVTIGEYVGFVALSVFAFCMYFLLGDSNMHRHQVTGQKNFQELHVWFTLSFLGVAWSFY